MAFDEQIWALEMIALMKMCSAYEPVLGEAKFPRGALPSDSGPGCYTEATAAAAEAAVFFVASFSDTA